MTAEASRAQKTEDWRRVLSICAAVAPCALGELIKQAIRRGVSASGIVKAVEELLRRGLIKVDDQETLVVTEAGLASLRASEPTMEEILASIRRIITDDEAGQARAPIPEQQAREEDECLEGEADNQIIDDIARVLSGSGAPATVAEEEEEILDLTAELSGLEIVEDVEELELVEEVIEEPVVMFEEQPVEFAQPAPPPSQPPAPPSPQAAPPQPKLSASEEPASALEQAISALRAGQLPSSKTQQSESFQFSKEPPSFDLDVSVFAPTEVTAGSICLVQVFLHQPDQRENVRAEALGADVDATRRGQIPLYGVSYGKILEVLLEGRDLDIEEPIQRVTWRGLTERCQFSLAVPERARGTTYCLTLLVLENSVPIGRLKFLMRSGVADSPAEISNSLFRHYRHAFLSYASPDRPHVIRGAQLLRNLGIGFFNDILTLEPGDRWEQRLFEEIDRADIFLLFWSSHAKTSQWVEKEVGYALARQSRAGEDELDIRPILLEGPPPPEPPPSLGHLHFNDHLMYLVTGPG